jgi:hypothetical protein
VLMANLAQSVEVRSAGAGTEVRMSFTRHI